MKACFMGLGYIGLPTAIIAAKHGLDVIGVDINSKVVEQTLSGHLHIVEPGLDMLRMPQAWCCLYLKKVTSLLLSQHHL